MQNVRLSREDAKKARELEELRKTGAAPPELDEDGKMINPHIPQYVSEAPWYLNINHPGLKHQYRKHFGGDTVYSSIDEHRMALMDKVKKPKRKKNKWVKGACENCGSTTHKTKECVERPRRRGAKLTNKNLSEDDASMKKLTLDYDGKRDTWAGYDTRQYQRIIDRFAREEETRKSVRAKQVEEEIKKKTEEREARRKARKEESQKRKDERAKKKAEREAARARKLIGDGSDSDDLLSESDTDTDTDTDTDDEDLDLDRENEKDDGQLIQKFDAKHRVTVRNLRIREDTAKYLRNLNINSAHYDPKSRSMRSNPHPDKDPSTLLYAGDNYVRFSGEAAAQNELERFVWQAQEKGNKDIQDLLANPSQAQLSYEAHKRKKAQLKNKHQTDILAKYGGEEHLNVPNPELLRAESEAYTEYSETGKVIKGLEPAVPKTKYQEDQLEGNHTEIWGSFYNLESKQWGYGCCHSLIRASYCVGDAGKQARLAAPPKPKSDVLSQPPLSLTHSAEADSTELMSPPDGGAPSLSAFAADDEAPQADEEDELEESAKKKKKKDKKKKKEKKAKKEKKKKKKKRKADSDEEGSGSDEAHADKKRKVTSGED